MDLNQITYRLIQQQLIFKKKKKKKQNKTIETIRSTLQPILHFNPTTPTPTASIMCKDGHVL